jgi:hypothetical protein
MAPVCQDIVTKAFYNVLDPILRQRQPECALVDHMVANRDQALALPASSHEDFWDQYCRTTSILEALATAEDRLVEVDSSDDGHGDNNRMDLVLRGTCVVAGVNTG